MMDSLTNLYSNFVAENNGNDNVNFYQISVAIYINVRKLVKYKIQIDGQVAFLKCFYPPSQYIGLNHYENLDEWSGSLFLVEYVPGSYLNINNGQKVRQLTFNVTIIINSIQSNI